MNELERTCRELRTRGLPALVPFATAGYPDEATSLALLEGCVQRGCKIVEVGVPFSDPIADGPVIQHASQAALKRGMTLRRALDLVRELSKEPVQPVMMTYLNPVLRLGMAGFARMAAAAGCAGVIVPDLCREESESLRQALDAEGICLVDLVAPTTPEERLAGIASQAAGFLYLVAIAGVTGTRSAAAGELAAFTARVSRHADLPLYVGFGIDGPERAGEAAACSDGVIAGSGLLRCFQDKPDPRAGLASALELVERMSLALAGMTRRCAP
jgi:tryptophan synthase alpha chain